MTAGEMPYSEIVLVDGGPRQRWTGTGPAARDALTGLVEILGVLHDLAVPRVLACEVGDPTVVDLTWPGPTTLANTRPGDPVRALALVGAVARTLQAAHRRGVGHGRLEPSLVGIDPRGNPVTTGFAPDFDLATRGAGPDAEAISDLVRGLLGDLPRRPRTATERRALTALRRMAEPRPHSIAELVTLSEEREPRGRSSIRLRPPTARTTAAMVGVVLILTAAAVLGPTGTAEVPRTAHRPAPPITTTAAPPPPTVSPTSVPGCPAIDGTGADIDGDGCLDEVSVNGTLVTSAEARWEVGTDGDVIVLGDWDCNGTATPAALRPATGAVFVFETWVDRTPVSIPPLEVTPGLTGLRVDDPDGDGCHRLLGVDAEGDRHDIVGAG